jgi:zinc protease
MLTLGTEVGAEVSEAALTEIYREMKVLQQDLVGKEELETVQKYMHGKLLSRFDGPFALADTQRSALEREESFSFYSDMLDTIYATTPIRLRQLAQTYLNPDHTLLRSLTFLVAAKL